MGECAVALVNPKYPRNVGNALRACSNFGASSMVWTPERVPALEDWPKGSRLPREERMKLYSDVACGTAPRARLIDYVCEIEDIDFTPVAVEVRGSAEQLPEFEHPDDALYVFGPEDGSLDRGILGVCHRFVVIPTKGCLNLAAAVNVVLYDRLAKGTARFEPHFSPAFAGAEG